MSCVLSPFPTKKFLIYIGVLQANPFENIDFDEVLNDDDDTFQPKEIESKANQLELDHPRILPKAANPVSLCNYFLSG